MSETPNSFNVRIYGLYIHNEQLLVSDELLRGEPFTKLPGGGLEFGESPIECLHREAKEEMNAKIIVNQHFYTTDEYIQSYFRPWEQVICSYYFCTLCDPTSVITSNKKMDFDVTIKGNQESFRWVNLTDLAQEKFNFLSDRTAIQRLIKTR